MTGLGVDRYATDAVRCSLPGHDRDCTLAILAQSRLRSSPIDEIQVAHLLAIGYRAGYAQHRATVIELLSAELAKPRRRRWDPRTWRAGR